MRDDRLSLAQEGLSLPMATALQHEFAELFQPKPGWSRYRAIAVLGKRLRS